MLDQLYGKPSTNWRRSQVFLVLLFWISRISLGNRNGPPLPFFRRLNRALAKFTPWQIVVSTLTLLYAVKHSDALLGLQAPEPLARLYSRNYYRATWIVTALDAGFATAMTIKWKWLRDISSLAFSGYYLFFANEADEKIRKYRAMCTVEMLRATWEKTTNPYIRFATRKLRPTVGIQRRILLPRPKGSTYTKPIVAWIYFVGTELELSQQTDLIFDLPGGGFICMSPEHHEERILRWTIKTGRPVISFDYGKAPEYPYPFAIDEAYDAYKLLYETKGKNIGMSGTALNVVLTGDSAGANIATAMMIKLLETRPRLPMPVSLVFAYAALSFHFTSWMPSSDLKVLRQESTANLAGLLRGKEHLEHRSPLSVVEDVERPRLRRRRTSSWGKSFTRQLSTSPARLLTGGGSGSYNGADEDGDDEGEGGELDEPLAPREDKDKSLSERVVFWDQSHLDKQAELQKKADKVGQQVLENVSKGPLETRLAMTSRTAFFNDRIISPPMCRAMALLYIGPRNAPDMHSDYHISPIFTPPNLLAQFPPVYLSCGERDPFVDDTVIFAGKLREAKEARKLELLARENKFGESLRMSGPSATRDPILDEDESDWVEMKILGGWSHGYLQMLSLLPEAAYAIDMMADWIVEAFDIHASKNAPVAPASTRTTSSMSAPPRSNTPPTPSPGLSHPPQSSPPFSSTATTTLAPPSRPRLGFASESDRDDNDNVLSFTPKKRSPRTSNAGATSSTRGESPAPPSMGTLSSSDETTNFPSTPEDRLSPVPLRGVEGSNKVPALASDHGLIAPPGPPKRFFTDPTTGSSSNKSLLGNVLSDEDGGGGSALGSGTLTALGGIKKTTRSGSAGGASAAPFVDAKDLLRRRRDEVVFGISASASQAGSAVPSDDESDSVKDKESSKKSKLSDEDKEGVEA